MGDPEALMWCRDHVLQCRGVTATEERCKQKIKVRAKGWLITPIEATPIAFCHSHIEQARITATYRAGVTS